MGSGARRRLLANVFLAAVVFIWIILPGVWTICQSLKEPRDVHTLRWIPWLEYEPTFAAWRENLGDPQLLRTLGNSVLVASATTVLVLVVGTPAAYGLARFRLPPFTSRDTLLFFLSQRFLPPVVVAVPLAVAVQSVGLYDNVVGLIVAHTAFFLPLGVLIARGAFLDIPRDLEEAALVDGCTRVQMFVRVVLPLALPGIAATALVTFGFSWNEFVAALLLTQYRAQTLPLFVAGSEDTWGLDMARVAVRGLIAVAPPLIVGLLVQRFVVRGLVMGAVKG